MLVWIFFKRELWIKQHLNSSPGSLVQSNPESISKQCQISVTAWMRTPWNTSRHNSIDVPGKPGEFILHLALLGIQWSVFRNTGISEDNNHPTHTGLCHQHNLQKWLDLWEFLESSCAVIPAHRCALHTHGCCAPSPRTHQQQLSAC